jgi:hypothetical protein
MKKEEKRNMKIPPNTDSPGEEWGKFPTESSGHPKFTVVETTSNKD